MGPTVIERLAAGVIVLLAGCGGGTAPAASIVIENVTLIDGTDRGAVPGVSVAVDGDRIVAIGPTGKLRLGLVGVRVDGRGKYLIPGLWDMHVHLFGYRERAFPLFLANGVTTIRETGGKLEDGGYLRQEVRFGRLLGPTVLIAGPVLDGLEMTTLYPNGRLAVPTPEAARRAVDSLADRGVDYFKVHSQTPRAAYFAILERARARGLTVGGHVPDAVTAREAIDSGQRTIEHDWGLALANSERGAELHQEMMAGITRYLATGSRFRLGPYLRFRVVAGDSALASYDADTAEVFARAAAGREVWFDPTLVVLNTQLLKNEPAGRDFPELRYVPKVARELEDGEPAKANPTAADVALGRTRWAGVGRTFAALVRAGAKFVTGTDVPVMPLVPGFALHRELALLVELGLTPLGALQAATRNPAQAMNRADAGTIEVGKTADLVLLRENPLARIANVSTVETVVARGRLLDRATLDRMLQDAERYAAER